MFNSILWNTKNLYNELLEIHKESWKNKKKGLTKFDYNNLSKSKKFPVKIYSQVLQSTGARLADAFQRFFRRQNRFPKFKSLRNFKSFTYPQNTGFAVLPKHIRLGGIGKVRCRFSRPIEGIPKTCTIKKTNIGDWYAYITVDDINILKIVPQNRQIVKAIDLGVRKFLTDQDGNYLPRPRFLTKKLKKLARAQRELSRKQKGSHNREKQRLRVAKIYEHIQNARRDHHFKVAHWLVNHYDNLICEDLQVSKMYRKKSERKQRRALFDVALYEFLTILTWMAEKYSCNLVRVDPAYTSQLCSNCGSVVPKGSSEIHNCPHCGLVLDRDINAARNILLRGLKYLTTNVPGGIPGGEKLFSSNPMLVEILISGVGGH